MISTGDLLIAPPKMQDIRFSKAVLLVTDHGPQGTRAVCINKDSHTMVNDILDNLDKSLYPDQRLFWGGPMASSTLWMLHDHSWKTENTIFVNEEWALTSNHDMLDQINLGNGPKHKRFMLGISSWAPGQLEMEIEGELPWNRDSSWILAKAPSPEELFSLASSDLWIYSCELSAQQAVKDWIN